MMLKDARRVSTARGTLGLLTLELDSMCSWNVDTNPNDIDILDSLPPNLYAEDDTDTSPIELVLG